MAQTPRVLPAAILLLGLALGACQAAPTAAPTAAPKAEAKAAGAPSELTEVTLQLAWLRNGQYGAIMVADARGYFAQEGIKLRLLDGGPGKNPIPIVGAGQAQFGVGAAAPVFQARTAPDPIDIVAIGTLLQKFPYAYISLAVPDGPALKPKDLEGKVLGMQSDGDFYLKGFAKKNNLDLDKIKIEVVQANAEPLMVGKVEVFTGFVTNQTYQIEQEAAKPDAPASIKGKTWKALMFADQGVRSYADVFFTTGKMIKENPDLARRFMRAVGRGLQFMLDQPEESIRLVATYPEQVEDAAKLAWRWKVQNPLATSDDTQKNGLLWMNPAVWEELMAFFKEQEQIPRVVPVAEAMTNEFVPGPGLKP